MDGGKIYAAIAAIMRETDAIGKDRRNEQQRFNYRGIDDVYNAIHGLFAKHGVFSTTEVIDERSEDRPSKSGGVLIYRVLRIRFRFYAEDGSYVDSVVVGEGMDSGDKASNKAQAVAHKYAILQLLSIPTDDPKDPDAESHEVANQPPIPRRGPPSPAEPPVDIDVIRGRLQEYYDSGKLQPNTMQSIKRILDDGVRDPGKLDYAIQRAKAQYEAALVAEAEIPSLTLTGDDYSAKAEDAYKGRK